MVTKKQRVRDLLITLDINDDSETVLNDFDAASLQEDCEEQITALVYGGLTQNQMNALYRMIRVARAAGRRQGKALNARPLDEIVHELLSRHVHEPFSLRRVRR